MTYLYDGPVRFSEVDGKPLSVGGFVLREQVEESRSVTNILSTLSDPAALEQVKAEALRSLDDVLADVDDEMRSRMIRTAVERLDALALGHPAVAALREATLALDIHTALKISEREAYALALRIVKVVAVALAAAVPGVAGLVVAGLVTLIPEPKETEDE